MKNKLFLLMGIFFLLTVKIALATPVIQNVSVEPTNLWLGEAVSISLNCFDDKNNTINQVYVDIVGPGIVLPTMYFTLSEGKYVLEVGNIYLERTGQFDVTAHCENNNSEITDSTTGFTISQLTGYINNIKPSPAYIGDVIEINFIVEKDGVKLSSGVSFNVKFNGELKSLKVNPAYDVNKGWILKLDSPSISDDYEVEVIAFYERTNASDKDSLRVNKYIEFEIVSINKEWVDVNDEVVVTLKALERGSVINLDENNVKIKIGSVDAEIKSITYRNNLFDVKIIAPGISSGIYQLKVTMDYGGSYYSDSKEIAYIVPIEGKIVNKDGKALSVKISFIKNGVTKLSLITDAFGCYSSSLPPDTYDVEIIFPQSKVYLYGAIINNFNDPIKYFYSHDVDVPGIINAGLHDFGIALTYSTADIKLEYNERNVDDETELEIFKCSNWNSGKNICNDDWTEINGNIDIVRNLVEISSSSLSAFAIGTIKSLKVDFSLDKEKYNLEDLITVRGILKDSVGKTVNNATIEVTIKNTDIVSGDISDSNGIFSISFLAPEDEGNYTLTLDAKKYPYVSLSNKKDFEVIKSRSVYINFPDTVRIECGKNFTQQFSLINTGQDDLQDLTLSLEGLPEGYYGLVSYLDEIKTDEEKGFYINFFVPSDAETGILSTTLKVTGENFYQEKVFGFNVVEKEEQEVTETPTGFSIGLEFPELTLDIIYVILLGAIGIVTILILKKRVGKKRYVTKNFLFDVKNRLKDNDIGKTVKEAINYDELISSEFPDALKNIKRGGKKW